jgi:hypothetical protein
MKKDESLDPNAEIYRNISSLKSRTIHLMTDNTIIEQAFNSRELFWDNQKENLNRLIGSLRADIGDVKRGFSENIVFTERIISDFRNKVKTDRVEVLKRNLETWKVEEFVTQKRFNELIAKEFNNSKK